MEPSAFDTSYNTSDTSAGPNGGGRATIVQGAGGGYTDLGSLGRAVGILFGIYAVVTFLATILEQVQSGQLSAQTAGTNAPSLTLDVVLGVLGLTEFGVFLATGILFLVWFCRAYRNLPALGARDLMATPGWAVGWFFVPIACLFRPFQVATEIWKASDPAVPGTDKSSRDAMPTWSILGLWWFAWLISEVMDRVSMQATIHPDMSNAAMASQILAISSVLNMVAAVFALLVVRSITQRQEEKSRRMVVQG